MTDLKDIKPDDSSFNFLMQTLLGDLVTDLEEADRNVQRYERMINGPDGEPNDMNLAMYGSLLNDSLKIKQSVRDKIIKVLGNLKDRVRVKEQQAASGNTNEEYSEEYLFELANKLKERQKDG